MCSICLITLVVLCNLQLVSVLREVRYLESQHAEKIPETASEIYASKESYRQYVATLELTANWYNKVRKSVLGVEFPLIAGQVQQIDAKMKEAEELLNWKNEGNKLICTTSLKQGSATCGPWADCGP